VAKILVVWDIIKSGSAGPFAASSFNNRHSARFCSPFYSFIRIFGTGCPVLLLPAVIPGMKDRPSKRVLTIRTSIVGVVFNPKLWPGVITYTGMQIPEGIGLDRSGVDRMFLFFAGYGAIRQLMEAGAGERPRVILVGRNTHHCRSEESGSGEETVQEKIWREELLDISEPLQDPSFGPVIREHQKQDL